MRGLSSVTPRCWGERCREQPGTPGKGHQHCSRVCSSDQARLGRWCCVEGSRISPNCHRWAQNPSAHTWVPAAWLQAQRCVPVPRLFLCPLPGSELTSLETPHRGDVLTLGQTLLSFICPDFLASRFLLPSLFRYLSLTTRAGMISVRSSMGRSPGNNLTLGAQALGSSRSSRTGPGWLLPCSF